MFSASKAVFFSLISLVNFEKIRCITHRLIISQLDMIELRVIVVCRLSGCTNAELMETLTCEVLSCLPQTSAQMTPLIDACLGCYLALGQDPISSTLLIANTQHRGTPCVPYVYSADHRFELCVPALTRSLSVRTSSPQNISLVLEVLEGFIPAIPEDSLSRHRISLFMASISN